MVDIIHSCITIRTCSSSESESESESVSKFESKPEFNNYVSEFVIRLWIFLLSCHPLVANIYGKENSPKIRTGSFYLLVLLFQFGCLTLL